VCAVCQHLGTVRSEQGQGHRRYWHLTHPLTHLYIQLLKVPSCAAAISVHCLSTNRLTCNAMCNVMCNALGPVAAGGMAPPYLLQYCLLELCCVAQQYHNLLAQRMEVC
jgi:hypothetical protein